MTHSQPSLVVVCRPARYQPDDVHDVGHVVASGEDFDSYAGAQIGDDPPSPVHLHPEPPRPAARSTATETDTAHHAQLTAQFRAGEVAAPLVWKPNEVDCPGATAALLITTIAATATVEWSPPSPLDLVRHNLLNGMITVGGYSPTDR